MLFYHLILINIILKLLLVQVIILFVFLILEILKFLFIYLLGIVMVLIKYYVHLLISLILFLALLIWLLNLGHFKICNNLCWDLMKNIVNLFMILIIVYLLKIWFWLGLLIKLFVFLIQKMNSLIILINYLHWDFLV